MRRDDKRSSLRKMRIRLTNFACKYELDSWFSVNKCDAVMTTECSFDCTTYFAVLNYYIVDYYDLYESNASDGDNRVGFVSNDGYVLLSCFDEAEPYNVLGYYTTTLSWTK